MAHSGGHSVETTLELIRSEGEKRRRHFDRTARQFRRDTYLVLIGLSSHFSVAQPDGERLPALDGDLNQPPRRLELERQHVARNRRLGRLDNRHRPPTLAQREHAQRGQAVALHAKLAMASEVSSSHCNRSSRRLNVRR